MNESGSCKGSVGLHTSDGDLIVLVDQGDEKALERLFERHSRSVYSVALAVLKETSAAEDVLQEVFLKLWRKTHLVDEQRGSVRGWLIVTARNYAIDLLRQRRFSPSIDEVVLLSPDNVSAECEKSILIEKARSLLAGLPWEQREALSMAFFRDMTHDEISRATGVPLGTIKSRIRTAIQFLAKGLRRKRRAEMKIVRKARDIAGSPVRQMTSVPLERTCALQN